MIHAEDIFEFDLKQFFDKINLDWVSVQLLKAKVPINIVKRIYYINTCACQIKPPYMINEFEHMMKKLMHEGKGFEEVVSAPRPISYAYRVRGNPQGSALSPTLSDLALHESVLDRPGLTAIMYADDGLYYGKIDQPILTPNSGMVSANIAFNVDKSG